MRVLIGADDPGREESLRAALGALGCRVVAVARSPQQLRALRASSPADLVLAPLELLAAAGPAEGSVPAVAVCAPGQWAHAAGPGIVAWVSEPLRLNVLRVVLATVHGHIPQSS
jgi:hypothetical protein